MKRKSELDNSARRKRTEPTWGNQLFRANDMTSDELQRHAMVSKSNNHRCKECFCCAALTVLESRDMEAQS